MPFVIFFLIMIGVLGGIVWVVVSALLNRPNVATARAEIKKTIAAHANQLAQRKRQLSVPDVYGNMDAKLWHNERVYFIRSTLHKHPLWSQAAFMGREILALVDEAALALPAQTKFKRSTHPADYERLCGDILTGEGWSVRVTQYTGDQGADVFATKNGVSLVLQCKLYSSTVGNKAVQEVVAARGYMHANHAAVVAPTAFSRPAQHLAHANGVALLHHDMLAAYSASLLNCNAVPPGAINNMASLTTP